MSPRAYPLFAVFVIFAIVLTACTSLPAQIVDDFGVPMALVPAGEFGLRRQVGGVLESPVDIVYLDEFYLDVYEVTNQRYADCVQDGVCSEPENTIAYKQATYLDHPVIYVTRDMAQAYCQWRGARLPSRAEWEKAAHDELEVMNYYWGDESPVCQVGARMAAKIEVNADFDPGTEAVGRQDPNSYGLHDMTGNVWEWALDSYGTDYAGSPSGSPAGLSSEQGNGCISIWG